ncbi:MAG: hypothetical protein MI974_28810 [Chitinophagales bacterium]|nr:hypothetical protein [Chitinophagales bacterium]
MSYPSSLLLARSLPPRMKTRLNRFIESPPFAAQPAVYRLWKWWLKHPYQPIDKEAAFAEAYPDKSFRSADWYLLLSRLQRMVEQFLVWEEVQQQEMEQYYLLQKAYRRLREEKLYKRSAQKAKKIRAKRNKLEASMLYWDYAMEKDFYDYIASHSRQERTNLQEVSDQLDQFYFAEKLKQACLAHSRKIANQENYDIHLLSIIEMTLRERTSLLDVPAIRIYYDCYKAVVQGGEEEDFQQLRRSIIQYKNGFPRQEIRDIYYLAINYCIRALNRGGEAFAKEALSLYELSLSEGYLLEDGHIPESTFSNIVSLGLRLKRYDWVRLFIQNQAVFLRPVFQESLPAFSRAKLLYECGQLRDALRELVIVETKLPFLYLGTKSLQLKIFYEQEEWDALDSLLESLRVYLQRRSDLGYHKEHYQLLLHFTRRLLQMPPSDRIGRQSLAEEINNTPAFREREWFIKQLE